MTRHLEAILAMHKARPVRDSDKLAKGLDLLYERLSDIQSMHNLQEVWRLAARTKREVEDLFGVEKK